MTDIERWELPPTNDPRVRAVWLAFKEHGWIIASLQQAQVAVAALDREEAERRADAEAERRASE